MDLKFKKSDKDILQGSPRTIDLIDGSRLFCKALSIRKLDIFLNYLIEETNKTKWIESCLSAGTNIDRLKDVLLDKLSIDYVSSEKGTYAVFNPHDFVSSYFAIQNEKAEIIPQESCLDAFITVIEQNNLLHVLEHYLKPSNSESVKTYSNSFIVWQIMQLGLVSSLTLLNWEDVLTFEQRDFYYDLVIQRENKQIQNLYLAFSTVKRQQFGDKIDIFKDVLFPESNKNIGIKEQNRKVYLGEKYTGNKELDDKLLEELVANSKMVTRDLFF
ncbi:MAG TPA: hypothetical protein V6C96_02020 [Vampirovibrionales bacterium]